MSPYNSGGGGGAGITQEQLDAAVKSLSFQYEVGRWYDERHNVFTETYTTSGSPSRTNEAFACRFFVQGKQKFDAIGIDASGIAGSACTGLMWIMDDDQGQPNNLLVDPGLVDMEPSGSKQVSFLEQEFSGVIWLCFACNLSGRIVGAYNQTNSSTDHNPSYFGLSSPSSTSHPGVIVMNFSLGSIGSEQSAPSQWVTAFKNTTPVPRLMLRAS